LGILVKETKAFVVADRFSHNVGMCAVDGDVFTANLHHHHMLASSSPQASGITDKYLAYFSGVSINCQGQ